MAVELIPGTALPLHVGPGGEQHEGRGSVQITPERGPRSLLEKVGERDDVSPHELAYVEAAIRAYDRRPLKLRDVYATTGRSTDATTGNCVIPLFLVPAGCEAHITNVTVDAPGSATINPAAPFANAASWQFLAAGPASSGITNAAADSLRPGLVAFAPTSAAGPMIPGQWTFNDTSAPILQGGDQLYFVVHGGSIAALLAVSLLVTYRINLYGPGQ